jgi:uncharacterized protein YcaQ
MSRSAITLRDLQRCAIARSLFAPASLGEAIERLGFVQADPIRAPARAQDLTLRHRVVDYRAGDLERSYATLAIDEDVFVNYGFVARTLLALMHPRTPRARWSAVRKKRAEAVLAFVRERGEVHPREVDRYFAHGRVVNYWGGTSLATTHLLDAMHYRGLLRVARRERGVRIYAPHQHAPSSGDAAARRARIDALIDAAVAKYAPLPAASLGALVRRLRYGAPQLRRGLDAGLARAKRRLSTARVEGVDWYWPADEQPAAGGDAVDGEARLLAPFDPVVWDRRRFELFWGWPYRFEAYTPASRRRFGYYALPLLWGGSVIGWANLTADGGSLAAAFGYASGSAPQGRGFARAVERELGRMRRFLGADVATKGARLDFSANRYPPAGT